MEIAKQKAIKGRMALLIATVIWGSSFFILKNALDEVPVFYVMALRFSIGAVLCLIGIRRHFLKFDRKTITLGILAGVFLFAAEIFQTYGLVYTTPAKNAFLTTIYCVIVPFLTWIFYRKRPSWTVFLAAGICIAGIGCISLTDSLTIGIGDTLTLICGFFYAMHIIILDKARDINVILLCLIQFSVTAALSWAAGPIAGEQVNPAALSPECWLSIVYMGICCSGICFFFQAYGQKYTPASQASIILILESVFGTIFSGIFYGETFTTRMIIGFVLVFIAVFISEAGPQMLKQINIKNRRQ